MKAIKCEPAEIADRWLQNHGRVMLFGPPGTGKTTLADGLGQVLHGRGRTVHCLGADPGSPAFGVPGALCLGRRGPSGWSPVAMEALCSLDAARFRLPLVEAARRLAAMADDGVLLVDSPGVVRGVAGAELLGALVSTLAVELVLLLTRDGRPPHLLQELDSLPARVVAVEAHEQAHRPGKPSRARYRTALWDRYLDGGLERRLALDRMRLLGTPPRRAAEAWIGKQVALLDGGRTLALGEVVDSDGDSVSLRLPSGAEAAGALLVRDACRGEDGLLTTGKPFAGSVVHYLPPPDLLPATDGERSGVAPVVRTATCSAALMNGVFGDPLLHVRLQQQRRSLLFDLGEGTRLPARIAHQVTDVFITHAHADHISGFLWFLRSRIGERSVCRLYGPPGLAGHVAGMINGLQWDRIGDRGPVFQVTEMHRRRLLSCRLQAGAPALPALVERPLEDDGVLLRESEFLVRAVTLDHGTPVLAFAYEPARRVHVLAERLAASGLEPGNWLDELKECIVRGKLDARIRLPDGSRRTVAALAEALTIQNEGEAVVYATDFADTPVNRERLGHLAHGAHVLFCEASFLERDRDKAERTGHLTTSACGEIARDAGVRHLVPFHFSRRYEHSAEIVYDEIGRLCPQLVRPTLSGEAL